MFIRAIRGLPFCIFRALSPHLAGQACILVANPFFAAGKSIRAYPRYPWPAFLYFSCPFVTFRGYPFLPQANQSMANPFAAGKTTLI
ncbi:MAG TPA: hypothetical protein PLU11_05560, partial [Chitinophagaceae bacterium]|nr:hypothetical protein [Chitinophagaceae bacterium]HPN58614.1 hypothetical protein [Chitinophagaceae bacterium]